MCDQNKIKESLRNLEKLPKQELKIEDVAFEEPAIAADDAELEFDPDDLF